MTTPPPAEYRSLDDAESSAPKPPSLVARASSIVATGVARLRPPITAARRRVVALAAPLGTRISGWVEPWLSLVTGLGRGVVAVGVVGLILAFLLGWVELLVIASVLLLSLLLGILSVLRKPHYGVEVDLAAVRVVVGERAVGELRVTNLAARSAPPILIELPVGLGVASLPIPRLDPEVQHDELFTIPTQRRAVLQLGPVRSVQQDPLRLLRRQVTWTEPEEIFVHPKTIRLDNSSTGFVRDLEGLPTRDLSNDDVSFHALREYQPGDDLRYVHWRSTARTGKLMIRQFEETRRSQFVIIVSTTPTDYADADEFELAISIAASLARSAQLDGKEVAVFDHDHQLTARTPDRLLDSFSAVEPSRSLQSYPDRVRAISADNPGASVVGLVTGSVPTIKDLHLASLRSPLMARCYGVRAASNEELGRRSVGDLDVITVPTLDNLPTAFRAVA